MNKTLHHHLLSIAFLGVVFTTYPASSYADHAWSNYHWARTSSPFTLKLGNNLTNGWNNYLSQASQDWNSPSLVGTTSPLNTAIVAGTAGRQCKGVTGTTQVCNSKYGANGWLGLATIYISGDHITKGSAKMNDTYFETLTYNNPNEKLHVMCQEVAHTFGLDHQSTNGESLNTCMDYYSNTGGNAGNTVSTKPNFHDFEELQTIYAHDDITTTLASSVTALAASPASNEDVTEDRNSWGYLVSQSANGRSSTYERHNSDGTKVITHVYWTTEAAARCPACDHRYDH